MLGAAAPDAFVRAVSFFQAPPAIYLAAAIRLATGLGLTWAASTSRLPRLLAILGMVIAIGGLVTPLVGERLAAPILDSWSAGGPSAVRLWGACALVLAGLLFYAFHARRSPVVGS